MVFGLDPTRRLTMTTDFWHTDPTLADESSPFELIFDLVFGLIGFGQPLDCWWGSRVEKPKRQAVPAGSLAFVDC